MKKLIFILICTCAFLLPLGAKAQYSGEHFILHASGLHLAKSASSAILEAATAANPQKMKITATSDGYYNIQAPDGTYLAQGGTNAWNTAFVGNGSGDVAKFTFEKADVMVLIKNKGTGKYLGVDAANDSTWVFIDKEGNSTSHQWYVADDVDAPIPSPKYSVIVNPSARRQEFEGFGVSLCWWAHMCGSWTDEHVDEIVEWLTSPEHLNFRIFRYNIGGGDDPENRNCTLHHMADGKGIRAEMPGFKAYENSEYDWSADEAQIKIMRKIKEKRPDAIFEAFSNSAPWWMTYSGCCSGAVSSKNDNLKPEYYEAFANYLVDVCKHMKDVEGIEFRTLDPFNEPMTSYWGCNGGQEGCHFDVQSQIDFIKVLYPILKNSGLNTVISASDETDIAQQVKDYDAFKNADVLKYIGQINSHTYGGDTNACSNLSAQCAADNIRLWMSEVGAGGNGMEGNLNLAKHLIRDMRYIEPNAWVDWQYIEEGNDQWCLIQAGFKSQNYRRVNNFYVREHFSKYILPGYTMLTSTNDNTLVAINPEGTQIVVVAVNADALETAYEIDLGLFKNIGWPTEAVTSTAGNYFNEQPFSLSDSYLSFKQSGLSISTFVIPVELNATFDSQLLVGEDYLLLPRNNNAATVTARDSRVSLQDIELSADQIWRLSADGNKYVITNRNGNKLTATDSYALSYTANATGTQSFAITPIGNDYYKIEANGKAMDLEGAASGLNTGVGMWDYGTSAAASHRQFRFMRLIDRTAITPEHDGIIDAAADSAAAIAPGLHAIKVSNIASAAIVSVYALDGTQLFTRLAADAEMEIPMPAGAYLVSVKCNGAATSRLVIVK